MSRCERERTAGVLSTARGPRSLGRVSHQQLMAGATQLVVTGAFSRGHGGPRYLRQRISCVCLGLA